MKKWIWYLFFSSLGLSWGWGQELSLHIAADSSHFTYGYSVQSLPDGYVMIGLVSCHDSTSTSCSFVRRIDLEGNLIWEKILKAQPDESWQLTVRDFLLIDDTLYFASMIRKGEVRDIRVLSMDLNGNILASQDYRPTDFSHFLRDMEADGPYFWTASYGLYPQGYKIHLMKFDHQLNLLGERFIGDPNLPDLNVNLKRLSSGEFVCAYSEQNSGILHDLVITRLDTNMQPLWERKMFPYLGGGERAKINPAEDGGYLVAWRFRKVDPFHYPIPTAIYKLDSLAEYEWEHIFFHKSIKVHFNTHLTDSGNVFGVGETDYWIINDIYPEHFFEAWCFLIAPTGQVLWERNIIDTRRFHGGAFLDGEDTPNGYVLGGVSVGVDSLDSTSFDHKYWLLTLDQQGCWNGDCSEYIIIDSDSTTLTSSEARSLTPLRLYPNPTSGPFTLELPSGTPVVNRRVEIITMSGEQVSAFPLRSPQSTLHLQGLPDGVYLVLVYEGPDLLSRQKVVLRR